MPCISECLLRSPVRSDSNHSEQRRAPHTILTYTRHTSEGIWGHNDLWLKIFWVNWCQKIALDYLFLFCLFQKSMMGVLLLMTYRPKSDLVILSSIVRWVVCSYPVPSPLPACQFSQHPPNDLGFWSSCSLLWVCLFEIQRFALSFKEFKCALIKWSSNW